MSIPALEDEFIEDILGNTKLKYPKVVLSLWVVAVIKNTFTARSQ